MSVVLVKYFYRINRLTEKLTTCEDIYEFLLYYTYNISMTNVNDNIEVYIFNMCKCLNVTIKYKLTFTDS